MTVWTPALRLVERLYWWLEERDHRAATDDSKAES